MPATVTRTTSNDLAFFIETAIFLKQSGSLCTQQENAGGIEAGA